MYEQVRSVINNNGLKVKLFIIQCQNHPTNAKMNYFIKNPKYDTDDLSDNLENSKFSPYELAMRDASDSFKDLKKGLFVGYSCLVIVINALCKCRSNILEYIFNAVKTNKHLRYKSKLIMSMYISKSELRNGKNVDSVATAFFQKYVSQLQKRSNFLHPTESEVNNRKRPTKPYFKMIVKDTLKSLRDSNCFVDSEPENTIFLQSFINRPYDIGIEIESVLHQTYNSPLNAMQMVLKKNTEIVNDFRLIQTSTSAEFYFYSINPALAIIINQYYFSNNLSTREGSDQDVLRLVRELKVAGIPYILIENCKQQELLIILKYLSSKNFFPLEKFLFFMMSHGDSTGNIYSTDDKVHIINDILNSIQNNESLKTCTNFINMVNCRGKIDASYADLDDFDDIRPSDSSSFNENSILLYSVPDQFKSPRSPQHGTPFISVLCKHFRPIYHNDSIRKLMHSVDRTLKGTKYYKNFPKLVTELVCKDVSANSNILPIPIVATNMIKLIQSIMNDFESLMESLLKNQTATTSSNKGRTLKTTFHITGNLCTRTLEVNSLTKKYFDKELDYDSCKLLSLFENVPLEKIPEHINKNFFKTNTY